jgi:uncharacterized DUF497 family protein
MDFIWDEIKNEQNIKKHGVDFLDIPQVFNLPMLVVFDDKKEYGEDRWIGIGLLKTIIVVIVYTELKNDKIRLISARKATKREKKYYEEKIKNEF